jgi:hypothetical protein
VLICFEYFACEMEVVHGSVGVGLEGLEEEVGGLVEQDALAPTSGHGRRREEAKERTRGGSKEKAGWEMGAGREEGDGYVPSVRAHTDALRRTTGTGSTPRAAQPGRLLRRHRNISSHISSVSLQIVIQPSRKRTRRCTLGTRARSSILHSKNVTTLVSNRHCHYLSILELQALTFISALRSPSTSAPGNQVPVLIPCFCPSALLHKVRQDAAMGSTYRSRKWARMACGLVGWAAGGGLRSARFVQAV